MDPQQEAGLASSAPPDATQSQSTPEPQGITPKHLPKRTFDPRSVFSKMGLPTSLPQELGVTQVPATNQPDESFADQTLPNETLLELRTDAVPPLSPAENLTILQETFSNSDNSSAKVLDTSLSPAALPMNPSASPDPASPESDAQTKEQVLQARLEKAVRQRQEAEARLIRIETESQAQQQAHQQELEQLKNQLAQQDKARQKQGAQQLNWVDAAVEDAAKSELASQMAALTAQLETRQRLNERQRQDIEQLQAQLLKKDSEAQQQQRQWEARHQELQVALVEAEDVAQKRVDMLQRFKAELSLARTQATETETELKQLKTLHSSQQAAWQEQREHLEARLQGSLETEAEAEQRWLEQRQDLEATIAAQQERLQETDQQLQLQQAQAQQWQQQQQEWAERLAQAEADLTAYQTEQVSLRQHYQADQAEIADLRARLAVMGSRLTESQTYLPELLETQRKLKQGEERRTDLERKLAQQAHTVAAQVEAIQSLEAAIAALKQKLTDAEHHNLRLKVALDSLTSHRNKAITGIPRLSKSDSRRIPDQVLVSPPSDGVKEGQDPAATARSTKPGIELPSFLRT